MPSGSPSSLIVPVDWKDEEVGGKHCCDDVYAVKGAGSYRMKAKPC
jgi:hypothetical protein